MKIKGYFVFALVFALFCVSKVNAEECDYNEQARVNGIAYNVNVIGKNYLLQEKYYEETVDREVESRDWYGALYIYNLYDEVYLKINGDGISNKVVTSKEKYKDGITYVSTGASDVIKKYKIDIYPSNGACGARPIRSIEVVIPRYNIYSGYTQCINNPNYYYCNELIALDQINEKEFYEGIDKYEKGLVDENGAEVQKDFSEIFKKMVIIILCAVGIGAFVLIIFYLIKRRAMLKKRGM